MPVTLGGGIGAAGGGGGISGTGVANRVAVWTGAVAIGSDDALTFSPTNHALTVNGVRIHAYPEPAATDYNTFVGNNSGNFTLTTISALFNTGVGHNTLNALTTGTLNTAVGALAGNAVAGGTENTAVGAYALAANVSGVGNVAIGDIALQTSTGGEATAVGHAALTTASNPGQSVAVGADSLYFVTTGTSNVGVGGWAGAADAGDTSNDPSFSTTTGAENVFVGTGSSSASNSQISNAVGLGHHSRPTNSNQTMLGNWSTTQTVVPGARTDFVDPTNLGAESLTNGALTGGASWSVAGDFSLAGDTAVYADATHAGTLTQASGTLAVAGVANAWYAFTYTVSGATVGAKANITSAFAAASAAASLVLTNGTHTIYFLSAAVPADFVLSVTSTAGGFTLDALSLKQVASVEVGSALVKAPVVDATTFQASALAAITISAMTNTTPPVATTAAAHNLKTLDIIGISGVTGLTNANGIRRVTVLSPTTFSLQDLVGTDIVGNGVFAGVPVVTTGIVAGNRVVANDGTAASPSIVFATNPTTGFYNGGNLIGLAKSGVTVGFIGSASTAFTAPELDIGAGPTRVTGVAAGTFQLGAADAASPVAQTLTFQGVSSGHADTAGADATIKGSLGRGSAASGKIVFQTGTPQAAGDTAHVPATVLTLTDAGTGGTAAPQALVAQGVAASPSLAFANAPTTGLYSVGANEIRLTTNGGSSYVSFGQSSFNLQNSAGYIGINSDVFLGRDGPATLRIGGSASASPIAQIFQAQGSHAGTDVDVAGANLTIRSGAGTGSATGSSLIFQTPTAVGGGSGAQTQTTRLTLSSASAQFAVNPIPLTSDNNFLGGSTTLFASAFLSRSTQGSKSKSLTDNSATLFATVAVASGSTWGGKVLFKLESKDGTDFAVLEGDVHIAAINQAGTITGTVGTPTVTTSLTTGGKTQTLNGFTVADAGSNVLNVLCNYTSDIADSANWPKLYFRLDSVDTATWTPV